MMQQIIHQNLNRNGNGNGSIGGRGILRRKLSHKQRTGLATDVALGLVPVELSMKQAAAAVGVRPDEIRAELKARAARGKVEEQERESAERAGAIVGAWVRASDEERAKDRREGRALEFVSQLRWQARYAAVSELKKVICA